MVTVAGRGVEGMAVSVDTQAVVEAVVEAPGLGHRATVAMVRQGA